MKTLQEIADLAGVSKSLAKKVLDGYERSTRAKTNLKIERVKHFLRLYRYNPSQSGYRRNKSKTRGYNKIRDVYPIELECWMCLETKPRKEFLFGPKEVLADGTRRVMGRCRLCVRKRHAKWRHNPCVSYKLKAKNRARYEESKEYAEVLKRAKAHEKRVVDLYKTCTVCNVEKWYAEFAHGKVKRHPTTDYPNDLRPDCRDCRKAKRDQYRIDNADYFKQKKLEAKHRLWREALELTDAYVNRILRGSNLSPMPYGFEYPKWMVEAKRVQLKAERKTNPKLKNHYERVKRELHKGC